MGTAGVCLPVAGYGLGAGTARHDGTMGKLGQGCWFGASIAVHGIGWPDLPQSAKAATKWKRRGAIRLRNDAFGDSVGNVVMVKKGLAYDEKRKCVVDCVLDFSVNKSTTFIIILLQ